MRPLCSGVFGNLLLLSAVVHTVSGSSTSSKKQCGIQTIEKATERSVFYRDIGIRLCQARCVEVGGCLRFEYNYETLICRLRLGESKEIKENEGFIAFQKNPSDVHAGPCTDMSCSLGSRCIESRSGKAVCVKDEEMFLLSRYQQHKRDQKRKSGDNILHEACREGDLSRVQHILTEGNIDINSRERENGMTPLMLAALAGHSPLFDFLAKEGGNMSLVDNKGNNILNIACHGGHLAIVKYIMSLDIVDINSRGQYGRTSAMTAAFNGKSEVFKFLVGKGANVSLVDTAGDNILHISCRGGHVRMVKYIISLDIVDINSRGQHGRTSVMMAALFGHRKVFDICACAGGNVSQVDANGCNILFLSCLGGHVEMVKYILSQNITDINSRGRYMMTPLHMAARNGHRDVFELVVDRGGDTSLVDINGDNILHLASIGGHLEMAKYILSRNITAINNRGIYGRTSVMLAARGGHRDVFDYLVYKGGNMSLVDNKGNNILHMACHGGHLAIVKYIMSLNIVDINSRGQYGRTSAMIAAYNGKSEVFKFLVGKGANVSLVDTAGDNILHISCRGGHVGIVKYIISLDIVDINSRGQHGRTSVMMAALFGHREVFDICACAGGNVSQVDVESSSILHLACLGGHVEMVKYIFSQNITDINSRGRYRMTPLHMAALEGHRKVFEFVVDKGGDTSLEEINGDNILHLACTGGNVAIVKYILSQNTVYINSRGMYKRTPLMVAALFGHREVFELVLDKGGDTSRVDTYHGNVLHLACIGGNVAIVKYILSQNFVDINSRGRFGRTPLMVAAAEGHIDLCYLLISKGSDVSVVDDNGCTILHVACYYGQVEIVRYILSQHLVDINDRDKDENTAAMIAKGKKHKAVYALLVSQG